MRDAVLISEVQTPASSVSPLFAPLCARRAARATPGTMLGAPCQGSRLRQEDVFTRLDRAVPLSAAAVLLIAAAAWLALVREAGMGTMTMTVRDAGPLSIVGAVAFLTSWVVMMTAMMLPSAAPMVALYARMHKELSRQGGAVPPAVFTLVYLAVWALFGVPVYAAGGVVSVVADASPAARAALPYGVAAVVLVAGVYQLSPLKRTCLRACRSPLSFLMGRWQPGRAGTLRLALAHAAYCVGCCWALMAVLVAAGAMGLYWVLLVAAFVLAEKVIPAGERTARLGGVALVLLAILLLAQPDLAPVLRGQGM